MAEPTYVSAGTYLDGSGTSANIAVPAGTAAGRVVLVAMFMDGNPLAVAPTPPTGFALMPSAPVQIPATSGSHSLYLYWKRLTGVDAGTYNFTWVESRYREAQAFLYSDVVASGTPFDASPGAAFETTSSTVTPAISCTSAGPDRRLVFAATNWAGGTWTAPTGHTKRMQGGAGVVTLTDRSWPTASDTGIVTATCTGSDKRNAWLGALIGTTSGDTPKALDDAASADATLSVMAAVPLDDTGAAAEMVSVGSLVALGDAAVAADQVALSAAAVLAEVASAIDALTVDVALDLADAGAAADLLATGRAVSLTEAGSAGEALTASMAAGLADEAAATEALGAAVNAVLADGGLALDALTVVGPPPEISSGVMAPRSRRGPAAEPRTRAGVQAVLTERTGARMEGS